MLSYASRSRRQSVQPESRAGENHAFAHDDDRDSARRTAEALAARVGGTVLEHASESSDLLVVGSRAGDPAGRVVMSAPAQKLIREARAPVVALPYASALGVGGAASARAA